MVDLRSGHLGSTAGPHCEAEAPAQDRIGPPADVQGQTLEETFVKVISKHAAGRGAHGHSESHHQTKAWFGLPGKDAVETSFSGHSFCIFLFLNLKAPGKAASCCVGVQGRTR